MSETFLVFSTDETYSLPSTVDAPLPAIVVAPGMRLHTRLKVEDDLWVFAGPKGRLLAVLKVAAVNRDHEVVHIVGDPDRSLDFSNHSVQAFSVINLLSAHYQVTRPGAVRLKHRDAMVLHELRHRVPIDRSCTLCRQCHQFGEPSRSPTLCKACYRTERNQAYQSHRAKRAYQIHANTWLILTPADWEECLQFFGRRCAYCLLEGDLTPDHVIPLAQGGSHSRRNLIPACPSCNQRKNALDLEAWYQLQASYRPEQLHRIYRWVYQAPHLEPIPEGLRLGPIAVLRLGDTATAWEPFLRGTQEQWTAEWLDRVLTCMLGQLVDAGVSIISLEDLPGPLAEVAGGVAGRFTLTVSPEPHPPDLLITLVTRDMSQELAPMTPVPAISIAYLQSMIRWPTVQDRI